MAHPPTKPKQRVGLAAWLFLGIAALCDAAKILLFFLNAVPVAGTAIDGIGSFFISIIEILVVFGGLWFIGIYEPGINGKSGMSGMLLTGIASAVDLVPVLDDIPVTTPTVLALILQAKTKDTENEVEYKKNMKKFQEESKGEQSGRIQIGRAAQLRAENMRQRAMQASLEAANDNAPSANDNAPLEDELDLAA